MTAYRFNPDTLLVLLESITTRILSDKLSLTSWVLPAIQWTNRVDQAMKFSIWFLSKEWTYVGQFAARPAIDTLTFSSLRNRQY